MRFLLFLKLDLKKASILELTSAKTIPSTNNYCFIRRKRYYIKTIPVFTLEELTPPNTQVALLFGPRKALILNPNLMQIQDLPWKNFSHSYQMKMQRKTLIARHLKTSL